MGGRKVYKKKTMIRVNCYGCLNDFYTNRPNQRHCNAPRCQEERKLTNMENYIKRQAKKLGVSNAK